MAAPMSSEVMAVVLFAALLHATWNALVRSSARKFRDTVWVVCGAAGWALLLLPLLPAPAVASWPYLAASVLVHGIYFTLVAACYERGELSFAYPVMRGLAPALTALTAWLIFHESLGGTAWLGILLVCGGVLGLARDRWRTATSPMPAAALALLTAAVIMVYTLIDGRGARLAGDAFSYTAWMFVGTACLLLAVTLVREGRDAVGRPSRSALLRSLAGGACILAAYGLVLWAMTRAPIALVAALRESSVVFAALLGAWLLGEKLTRWKWLAILAVGAGAMVIKTF
jgi:drug/metabolite transporter (DMT)-like permease